MNYVNVRSTLFQENLTRPPSPAIICHRKEECSMPATNKKQSGISLTYRLPAQLYRQAIDRADGISMHSYLTHLIWADLRIDPETQDEVLYRRDAAPNLENLGT